MSRTPFPCRKLVSLACLCFLFQFCSGVNYRRKKVGIDLPVEESALSHSDRTSKNLFPFVWVTFQPSPCGTNNDGVCVQRGKCSKRGGTASGNCQDGFGDCCTLTEQCNENRTQIDVNQLVTTLMSPSPVTTQCSFRFRKEPNICQIRLDFTDFMTASATDDGMCEMDRLKISNSITVPSDFTTCGNLNGQHMYLTFGSQDMIEVTPLLKATTSRYKILATRIPCDSKNRAPDYCLQYFTKPSDIVKSFDYGGQQQDSQQYTACVKPMPTSASVKWMPCTGTTGKTFDIITNFGPPATLCDTDWVQVKGGDKICDTFPMTQSKWKPYDLLVNFDAVELPPPPPSFNMPVNPDNCDAECTGQPPLNCACIGTPATQCQCILDMAGAGLPAPSSGPDMNNTGFCLEYTQL